MNAGRLVLPALRWSDRTGFSHESTGIAAALEFGAGGFIIIGGTVEEVSELTEQLRREAGRPLLIASDLERGAGQQVSGLDELPPPRAIAGVADLAVIRGAGVLTAVQALSVGINWVLAPVCDLDVEPLNPIVQTRSFGDDPETVAAAVSEWIVGCEGAGAMACAKHFPGHGRTRSDSHLGMPLVGAPADQLRQSDLLPFAAAVAAGVSSIQTAHVAYLALDPTGTAATFSKPILDILREEMGFGGLVVSDALVMDGAREGRTSAALALDAVRAGVDLLLYPDDPVSLAVALERAVMEGSKLAVKIEASLARYQRALATVADIVPPGRQDPAGSVIALADRIVAAPLLRGARPALTPPLELVIIDDDQGTRWQLSSNAWVRQSLRQRGVPLERGGSRVVLAFAEPRGSKGRPGFGPESLTALAREAPGAALVVLFGHPRLLDSIPGAAPVLLGWHRQRLMQEAAARWIHAHLGR